MILKNNANERCLKIKEEKDGLDFFFKSKPDAMKLLEFIQVNF
jgi:NMD protein affecting ribosome stability and mRNA decay